MWCLPGRGAARAFGLSGGGHGQITKEAQEKPGRRGRAECFCLCERALLDPELVPSAAISQESAWGGGCFRAIALWSLASKGAGFKSCPFQTLLRDLGQVTEYPGPRCPYQQCEAIPTPRRSERITSEQS